MKLIDGTTTATIIRNEIKQAIRTLTGRKPRLDVILVGDFAPSVIYVTRKHQACLEVGMESIIHHLPTATSEEELLKLIHKLNQDDSVDGVLVQLPLPSHMDPNKIMFSLHPSKDVDGFHPINRGKLFIGDETALVPCTPLGVVELLKRYDVPTSGKRVVILGRSNLVGKPLAILLMQNHPFANATVTVVHSKSENVDAICAEADILVAAIGSPKFVKAHMVKPGAVVVDVGMNALNPEIGGKRKLCGDVDFDAVKDQCRLITPVPGGVGPMTIAMLLSNTLKAYRIHTSQE